MEDCGVNSARQEVQYNKKRYKNGDKRNFCVFLLSGVEHFGVTFCLAFQLKSLLKLAPLRLISPLTALREGCNCTEFFKHVADDTTAS